ncbi:hypothetical protein EON81_00990 [bacterium]|nr:MAG: hypothetical protein EON81_00990 [bacterium]
MFIGITAALLRTLYVEGSMSESVHGILFEIEAVVGFIGTMALVAIRGVPEIKRVPANPGDFRLAFRRAAPRFRLSLLGLIGFAVCGLLKLHLVIPSIVASGYGWLVGNNILFRSLRKRT